MSRFHFNDDVDMIRHDHPRDQPVSLAVEELEGLFDNSGDLRPPQPATAVAGVKIGRHSFSLFDGLCALGKERDRLNQSGVIEVGKVAPGEPAPGLSGLVRPHRSGQRRWT